MSENSEIMRAVKEGLDSLQIATDGEWTMAVKTELCRIGRSFGYKVYANPKFVAERERDGGEWLYDVTWLQYETGGGELIEAPLVAECEWHKKQEIENDFEKLLLARAGVRVMIVDAGGKPGSERIAKLLDGKVKKFEASLADDAWLLAAWESNEDGWRFRYFKIGSGPSATEK